MTDPSHPKVISESVDVDAPPEVVFAILSDPRQHARIDGSGSVRELVKGPERLSKGATFGMDMKLFGLPYKIRNTVVEYDENRQIAWRHFGGHRWRYVLEPTATGTRVTESFDYSRYRLFPRLWVELAGFRKRNREGIAGTLVKLREAAESDAFSRSRITYVAGGALLVTGVVLFFVSAPSGEAPHEEAALVPWLGPQGFGVSGRF